MTNLALVVSLLLKGPMLESGGHDLGYQVYDGLFNEVVRLDRAADAAWTQCASPAALAERQSEVRNKVIEAIGGFPERTPLNAKTTGVVERDGCKIEKVLFESRPGHFVTAHLFLPDTARYAPPWPGVVVPCGHSLAGKRAPYYQRAGLAGARAGLATLIYDPIEQGERRQRDDKGWKGSVKGHNHIGHRAHLLGWSTAQFRIWDGMRACDYIASRSDVDAGRIGVTGMSGGGTLSAYLNALDSRFCAAAPSGFISTIRDVYDNLGPQDAEQVVFGQAAFGFNHLGIVSLRAPSPLLVVATHGDYFPFMGSLETFANAKKVYSLLGAEGNVALMESAGPHGWYESTRAAAMRWLKRWTARPPTKPHGHPTSPRFGGSTSASPTRRKTPPSRSTKARTGTSRPRGASSTSPVRTAFSTSCARSSRGWTTVAINCGSPLMMSAPSPASGRFPLLARHAWREGRN